MFGLMRAAAGTAAFTLAVGTALVPAAVASAATNLLPNGTFTAGTTSGWRATNATLSVASPDFDGDNYAARVKLSGTSSSYAIYAYPKPATSVAQGTQLQGTGEVLGVSGRSLCLLLQEYTPGGSLVQTQKQCVTANGTWQAIGPATLTDKNAGDSVGFRIRQTGAVAGDSFQADSLSMTESSFPAPTVAAHWPMNETSGTTMYDISGSNNGTLYGPVTVGVPGEGSPGYSTAYSFSGKSTVDVPYSPTLVAGSANITISFWLNTTHLPSSGDYDLVRMGDYPYQEYKVELVNSSGVGQIDCTYHGSSSSNHAMGGSNVNDGKWHYVQCIKTASQIQLWVDGTEVKYTNAVIGSVSPTQDAFIGAHGLPGTASGYDWYQGDLGDAEITFG
jgi:Concanavalin A-like lectin/glucanases superfamily